MIHKRQFQKERESTIAKIMTRPEVSKEINVTGSNSVGFSRPQGGEAEEGVLEHSLIG